jgi:hypothetical protein
VKSGFWKVGVIWIQVIRILEGWSNPEFQTRLEFKQEFIASRLQVYRVENVAGTNVALIYLPILEPSSILFVCCCTQLKEFRKDAQFRLFHSEEVIGRFVNSPTPRWVTPSRSQSKAISHLGKA